MSSEMDPNLPRTRDVEIMENVPFSKMMLSNEVLTGLTSNGFIYPSPIQLRAIPIGCCGLDLLIKAKSGTGKTLVFCTLILERFKPEIKAPQSLIVVPTREISEQIRDYLNDIGKPCPGFKAASFIGGRDILEDRKAISSCRAIVGTPGRLLQLISNGILRMEEIQLFVLDEADKLLNEGFQSDIKKLMQHLPTKNVQKIASSATYSDATNKILFSLMENPIGVTPSLETPVLLGVKQYTYMLENDEEWLSGGKQQIVSIRAMTVKVEAIKSIFSSIAFKQAIVFSNSQMRAESYCSYLLKSGWKADVISGSQDQSIRLETFNRFKTFQTRILVATDLMARGIDVENINLVINLDVPAESATYLHRIGRCGRFGSQGTAITIIGNKWEYEKFNRMLIDIGGEQLNVRPFRIEAKTDDINGNGKITPHNGDIEVEKNISENPSENIDEKTKNTEQNHEIHPSVIIKELQTNSSSKNRKKQPMKKSNIEKENINLLKLTQLMVDAQNSDNKSPIKFDFDLFDMYDKVTSNGISKIEGSRRPSTNHSVAPVQSEAEPLSHFSKSNAALLDGDLFNSYKTQNANSHVSRDPSTKAKEETENSDKSDGNISDSSHITNSSFSGQLNDLSEDSSSSSEFDEEDDFTTEEKDVTSEVLSVRKKSINRQTAGNDSQFLKALRNLDMRENSDSNVSYKSDSNSDNLTKQLRCLRETRNTGNEDKCDRIPNNRTHIGNKSKVNGSRKVRLDNDIQLSNDVRNQHFANWSQTYWNQVYQIRQYVHFSHQQPINNSYY